MLIKNLDEGKPFTASDSSEIKEILHPKNDKIILGFSLAYAKVLPPNKTTMPHALDQEEVYYVLKGTGRMTINTETSDVKARDVIYIPPNKVQYLRNTSETETLEFLCFVCPAWEASKEKVIMW
jgi:mannose-6-phosphate isomerase-like protein (cupin superfamily)